MRKVFLFLGKDDSQIKVEILDWKLLSVQYSQDLPIAANKYSN